MKRASTVIVAFLLLGLAFPLYAQEVQLGDIRDGKITLIGLLGRPLGTVVTVEGQLVSAPRSVNGHIVAALRANKVDGKELNKAQIMGIQFRASDGIPSLRAHQLVKFSAYEGAAFVGTPDAAREVMSSDASPLDWKLESIVYVVRLL